jgi:hypothetical protein
LASDIQGEAGVEEKCCTWNLNPALHGMSKFTGTQLTLNANPGRFNALARGGRTHGAPPGRAVG